MAQRNIDFGTFPNDPDADAIRIAFQKTQENFTELFAGLDQQGVLSVNQTPGAGISVFPVTGNVVVSADIACVTIQSSTLAVGVGSNTGNGIAIMTDSSSQSIYVDLPANITGVTNANLSGTVTANTITANLAITSSNTIGASGNITGGNLNSNGAAAINGNVTAANIYANSGTIGASLLAGTLKTNAQPNITSVGTLTSLSVTGTIGSGNANLGNTANANYFVGNGYYLTDVIAAPGNLILNANSEISIPSPNSSILMSVAGTANVLIVAQTGANVTGNLGVSGNLTSANANLGNTVSANYFIGNFYGTANSASSATTATTAGTVTTNAQPNITSVGTLTTADVTGNVTAGNVYANSGTIGAGTLKGEGGNISNIQGANVSGTVSSATTATTATTATSATTAGTVTTNAQPNITSVGTLTSLDVTANVTSGNVYANSGTIGAQTLKGEGGNISNIQGGNVSGAVSSATTATTAGTVTTNAQPNITSVGTLTSLAVTGNITGANIYANSGTIGASLLTGTLTTNAQPNITSVGTLTSASVTGNVTAGNVYANSGTIGAGTLKGEGGNISNIQGANVSGAVSSATTSGTVTTAAQPNITSVGTLSSLSITGNLSAGNANLGNLVTANYFSGDGSNLTNISVGAGSYIENGNSEVRVDANSNVRVTVAGNANVVTVTGTGANIAGTANITGNLSAGNISATLLTGTIATASNAQPNITSLGTLTALDVNGIANLGAVGNVRISGGSNNQVLVATGTGSNLAFITATGLTTAPGTNTQVLFNDAGSFAANANMTFDKTTGTLSAHSLAITNSGIFGNVFANSGTVRGNLLTGTLTTAAQPNITSVGSLASLIVGGNINAGNIAGGNAVTANFFIGSGANLTSVPGANVTGSVANATAANALLTNTSTSTTVYPTFVTSSSNGYYQNYINSGISANLGNASITATTFVGALSGAATSATTAGTVTTNAQPNITSTGTLTGLTVNGNAALGRTTVNFGTATSNVHALTVLQTWNNSSVQFSALEANIIDTNSAANSLLIDLQIASTSKFAVSKEGNVFYSGVITGNGSGLSSLAGANVTGTVSSATAATNAAALLQNSSTSTTVYPTFTTSGANGNSQAVFNTSISANLGNASITATTFVGALSGAATSATTAGTVTTNAQPNITSVGTLTTLGVNNTVTAVAFTANTGVFTGNGSGLTALAGGNVTGQVANALVAGTVYTAAQPNITSVGTLTSLGVSGNITAQANVNMSGYVIRSVATAISAAGTAQGNATAITKEMNVVSTVASGAGVVLPTAVSGMVISITNTSANTLLVYPATSAAINSGAANAAYSQPAGATLQYLAPTTTQWYTVGATFA